MRRSLLLFPFFLLSGWLFPVLLSAAEGSPLRAGPVVLYAVPREAGVWLELAPGSTARLLYWKRGQPDQTRTSDPVTVFPAGDTTAVLQATDLEPGTPYEYAILLGEEPVLLPFRTGWVTPPAMENRPSPPTFDFLALPGQHPPDPGLDPPHQTTGFSEDLLLFAADQRPAFVLWPGNTHRIRESDLGADSGILRRIRHTRLHPQLRPLLAQSPQYAVPGPADFGPRQTGPGSYDFLRSREGFKKAWHPREQLRWGDVDFFFLDTMQERDPLRKTILSEDAIEALIRRLLRSDASFKIIVSGTPLLHPAAAYPALAEHESALEAFLSALRRYPVDGLFFISGGFAQTELTKRIRPNRYPLYELSLAAPGAARPTNYFREPGTADPGPNFAWFRLENQAGNRILGCTLYDADGSPIWTMQWTPDTLSGKGP